MANQIDSRPEDYNEETFDILEETPEAQEQTQKGYEDYANQEQQQEPVEQVTKEEEDDIPDKYQGKSIKDIIAMHQNAEKLLGKQSSEVGELRRTVDDFIKTQTIVQQQAPATTVETSDDVDDLDFFEDPKKAVSKLLENHPSVKQSQQMALRLAQQEAVAQLKANHPDYTKIVKDEKFLNWVGQSKIRTDLLRRADAYDYESANELFSLWKERQNIVNDTVATETQARKQAVKSASTGNAKGSGEQPKRKIYRRADIVELMTKDPERYQALASEIRKAYAEGRVK